MILALKHKGPVLISSTSTDAQMVFPLIALYFAMGVVRDFEDMFEVLREVGYTDRRGNLVAKVIALRSSPFLNELMQLHHDGDHRIPKAAVLMAWLDRLSGVPYASHDQPSTSEVTAQTVYPERLLVAIRCTDV